MKKSYKIPSDAIEHKYLFIAKANQQKNKIETRIEIPKLR
jgi:hypothetical protein